MAGGLVDSVTRQFDDEPGGGFADEVGSLLDPGDRASEGTEEFVGTAFESTSPFLWFTNTDESVGRQFDETEGGGFADDAADAAGDAADAATPAWLSWVLNNQEVVVVGLVALAALAATNGTLDLDPRGGA